MTVLPKENALPSAEGAAATRDRDVERGLGECRSHVRGHVVWTLSGVNEEGIPVGNEAREERIEVALNVGVGILVDDQRGARMVHEHRTEALGDVCCGDGVLDALCDLDSAAPSRVDGKGIGTHAHDSVTLIHIAAWSPR